MQQSFNMEQTSFATENLKNTVTTVNAMKQANKQLKKQYKKVNIDKIEVSIHKKYITKKIYIYFFL